MPRLEIGRSSYPPPAPAVRGRVSGPIGTHPYPYPYPHPYPYPYLRKVPTMFQILSHDYGNTVAGWSGANPYGMVRLSLTEHVALVWAQVADEYHSAEHRGDYVAHVPLNDGDAAFLDLCEAIDAAHITTSDHPYPFGTWNYSDPADLTAPNARRGPWTMLVYVDDRGWPTYEVLTATDARDHFNGLAADFYDDDDD